MRSLSSGWTEAKSLTAGSVFDFEKGDLVAALRSQRERTMELLRGASEEAWEKEVVPRWRLREVAAHLVTTDEGTLTGRVFSAGMTRTADQAMISNIEAWNDRQVGRWADRPVDEILAGLEKWSKRIERLARVVPSVLGRPPIITPFGRVSLLWLTSLRVYDEWIHDEDIRRALEMPSDDAPTVVKPVARQIQAGIPVQTLPRVRDGAKGRVVLSFDDVQLPVLGVDLGAKTFGYGVETADARITANSAKLAMVCARRDAWRDAETSGALKIEGERAAAESFLEALLLV